MKIDLKLPKILVLTRIKSKIKVQIIFSFLKTHLHQLICLIKTRLTLKNKKKAALNESLNQNK